MNLFSEFFGFVLSDIIGGFIFWLVTGCKKNKLKEEIATHTNRNQLITFVVIMLSITIIFLILIRLI